MSETKISTSSVPVLGVRRDDITVWERRVPLTPQQVASLVNQGFRVLVQPSLKRCFPDAAFEEAGAEVREDLSEAALIVGVKRVPPRLLLPDRTYLFFSHTIKGQPENMDLLDEVLKRRVNLVDYECITEGGLRSGKRLVAFGEFAGMAGMVDFLWGLGQRLLVQGCSTPFLLIAPSYTYGSVEEAKRAVKRAGDEIALRGLPAELCPLVFAFTGTGRVTKGAKEIFDLLPNKMVAVSALPSLCAPRDSAPQSPTKTGGSAVGGDGGASPPSAAAVLSHCLIGCVLSVTDYTVKKDAETDAVEKEEYYAHPQRFRCVFGEKVLPYASAIIHGMYWDMRFPKVILQDEVADLQKRGALRLFGVCDISCDMGGSNDLLTEFASIDEPFRVVNAITGEVKKGVRGEGVMMHAVDQLPTEFAKDASHHFGSQLLPLIPQLLQRAHQFLPSTEPEKKEEESFHEGLCPELGAAVIAEGGSLAPLWTCIDQFRAFQEREAEAEAHEWERRERHGEGGGEKEKAGGKKDRRPPPMKALSVSSVNAANGDHAANANGTHNGQPSRPHTPSPSPRPSSSMPTSPGLTGAEVVLDLRGHLFDSSFINECLDALERKGTAFRALEWRLGQGRDQPTALVIAVAAKDAEALREVVRELAQIASRCGVAVEVAGEKGALAAWTGTGTGTGTSKGVGGEGESEVASGGGGSDTRLLPTSPQAGVSVSLPVHTRHLSRERTPQKFSQRPEERSGGQWKWRKQKKDKERRDEKETRVPSLESLPVSIAGHLPVSVSTSVPAPRSLPLFSDSNADYRVLVLGAGFVVGPLLQLLLGGGSGAGVGGAVSVCAVVCSVELEEAQRLAASYSNASPCMLDVSSDSAEERERLEGLVEGADVVVSLVPAPLHPRIARACLRQRRHLVTASYVSEEMEKMDEEAKSLGLTFLNEVGLDPGIDHMSAIEILQRERQRGGRVVAFRSVCGGLPAPEDANNPLGYKFSWSPMGVLRASGADAKWEENGKIVEVPGGDLLAAARPFRLNAAMTLEELPNRDSTKYAELYGIEEDSPQTVFRGTLRYPGWSLLMWACREIGLFGGGGNAETLGALGSRLRSGGVGALPQSWGEVFACLLGGGLKENGNGNANEKGGEMTVDLEADALAWAEEAVGVRGKAVARIEKLRGTVGAEKTSAPASEARDIVSGWLWLGLLSDQVCVDWSDVVGAGGEGKGKESDAELGGRALTSAFCKLLMERLRYGDGEVDVALMCHKVEVERSDGSLVEILSSLCVRGDAKLNHGGHTLGAHGGSLSLSTPGLPPHGHHQSAAVGGHPHGSGTPAYSAMSKTVGLTVGACVELLLQRRLTRKGVLRPLTLDIAGPVLRRLDGFGISFREEERVLLFSKLLHLREGAGGRGTGE
uniref:Alanine dehydrogenase/pyridine nucleotide transhydrogenase N-terminal domain-containing protein n=1 Tax=Chromera velia CCMP2878 TaxID=1169474 RepID=A0A0G4H8G7_9ALVE|eukprot:Cvel_25094.t1-p1 / transcript=Cvel_25094.t1 / gene=Cvel_25094 / organism=Chromera_velia_CCMP2878 / gene_product=Alpha-aminoadipic semialdehyde synthase, putative / transcript_product=Alpha-aminoadipic semialdehyde synthase, putative / location=Cvel_scaffold2797:14934-24020(-) / protein_length=1393 / sequence_SO=supercontig / SO=protein_coding / is_pseudo=false